MSKIEEKFQILCNKPSDINEHLPVLKKYALECDIVVEMGVRSIVSTWAFMSAKPKKIISVDIVHPSKYKNHDPEGCDIDLVEDVCKKSNIEFNFILSDTLKLKPIECDLLFIDTLHDYDQLKGELNIHARSCRKYIILHDTTHFEFKGESPGTKGIGPAIDEFISANKEWIIFEKLTNNNGLTILKKI
mgnify:CR=1 FL=1